MIPSVVVSSTALALAAGVWAQEPAGERISGYSGGFDQLVPFSVPAFHGVEPHLALSYSSYGRNGFVGVGWTLAGFSSVERTSPGRGAPRWNASDVFLLDGQELIACAAGNQSPSCATGGTHSSSVESYLRIQFNSGTNQWTVWTKDGTRNVFSAVFQVATGTVIWGLAQRVDTHGNTAAYGWSCVGGDCYPASVQFGPYAVTLYREPRSDVPTWAVGDASVIRTMGYRLRSALLSYRGANVRAWKLGYVTSPVTGASLLASVEQHGKDVVIDAAGSITGVSPVPKREFTYQGDAQARRFVSWPGAYESQAPPPPTELPGDPLVTGSGGDGALVVAAGQTSYTDSVRSALAANALAGASSVVVADGSGFAVGQEVLAIQSVGSTAGTYETHTVTSVSGNTLTLGSVLVYDYSTTGSARAQVIRIPNYSSVTVQSGGTLRAHAWDGATGGVVVLRSSGAVTVEAGGVLHATGLGPLGGAPGAASSLLANGNVAGQGGAADWINQHCPVYEDTGQIGACDSCDHGPCQEIRGGDGTAAYAGIGSPVPGGAVTRGCAPYWCYGGYGGAGGQIGLAGAVGNPGSPGTGPGGAGAAGAGGTNAGSGAALAFGGSGGGGYGGGQGFGGGGGGGGGGGAGRYGANGGGSGAPGGRGGEGGAGGAGGRGGGVIIVTAQSISVAGTVSAAGGGGANGTGGAAGESGGAGGASGSGSGSCCWGDASGAQGQGGRGAVGGQGGAGGGGGAGGTIALRAHQIDTNQGTITVAGGPGGTGGPGGAGGAGGAGPSSIGAGASGNSGGSGSPGGNGRVLRQTF